MKRSSLSVKPDESSIVQFVDMKDTIGAKRPKEIHHWKMTAKVQRCGYPSVKTRRYNWSKKAIRRHTWLEVIA